MNAAAAAAEPGSGTVEAIDAETGHLVSRWLHHRGLHDAARLVWLHTAADQVSGAQLLNDGSRLNGQLSYPPPLPHPTLPDDALRLLMRHALDQSPAAASISAASPRRGPPPLPRRPRLLSSLPRSLFHCGSQSVVPYFRSRPLHAVWTDRDSGSERAEAESEGSGGLVHELAGASSHLPPLRATSYLSCLPSLSVRSGSRWSVLSSTAALGSFRCLKRLYGHLCPVYSVVFDMSGDFFFTGSDDHLVKVWSARSARLLWTLRGHAHEVTDIAVSPDNSILASASWDHSIRIWQLQHEASPLHVFFHQHTNKIWRIAFHPLYRPGHRLLFSACMDGTTQIFDLDNCNSRTVTLYADPLHLKLPNTITAFTTEEAVKHGYHSLLQPTLTTPDRQQPTPAAISPQQQQPPQQLPAPNQPLIMMAEEAGQAAAAAASSPPSTLVPEMLCITHHPDGSEFALGSNDRCIRVYRMADKQLVALLKGHAGEIDQLHYDHHGKSAKNTLPRTHQPQWLAPRRSVPYRLSAVAGVDMCQSSVECG